MYPEVFLEYAKFIDQYGPVTTLPTRLFFVGPDIGEEFEVQLGMGKQIMVKVQFLLSIEQVQLVRLIFLKFYHCDI